MKARAWLIGEVWLVLALALASSPAVAGDDVAWPQVTVLMDDGSRHQDVTVTWALGGYLIDAAAADGSVTTLNPDHIVRIVDRDGRDLSDEIDRACPATDITYRLLGRRRTVPFRFKVMADAGPGVSMHNANAERNLALVTRAGLRFAAGERIHLRLGYRRERIREEGGSPLREVSVDADEVEFLLGVRLADPRDNNNYSYLEGGVVRVMYAGHDDAGALLQGGVVMPVSPRLGVDVGAMLMSRPAVGDPDGAAVLVFGLQAALAARW